jgi:hypothetical protein
MTDIVSHECEMGFPDLFRLAKKRAWTPDEVGADGVTYTVFWAETHSESPDA